MCLYSAKIANKIIYRMYDWKYDMVFDTIIESSTKNVIFGA